MNVLIICFSQTGNTTQIAEQIRRGITGSNASCDVMHLKKVKVEDISDYQLIGIGSPVYYYQEPFNVGAFISSLPDLKAQHWFVFCTHGNIIGNFFPSVQQKLSKKKATIIGYHNSYASISVPFYPKFSYTSGHPDNIDLQMAEEFGREIVERSRNVHKGKLDLIPPPGPVSSAQWLEAARRCTPDFLDQVMPKLNVDHRKCTRCGTCQANCPVDGIDIESDPPRIQTPCIYCWNCVMVCPTQAVQGNWDKLVQLAPENYRQYRIALDQASAKGEFRWLVDPDSVRPDAPCYRHLANKINVKSGNHSGEPQGVNNTKLP